MRVQRWWPRCMAVVRCLLRTSRSTCLDPVCSPCSVLPVEPAADGKGTFVKDASLLLGTALCAALLSAMPAAAQGAATMQTTQQPTTQQPTTPRPASSTTFTVPTNPFLGGVPTGIVTAEPLRLTVL